MFFDNKPSLGEELQGERSQAKATPLVNGHIYI